MNKRRIESKTSRTAEMTCLSRACSALEKDPYYHSGDTIAPLLLPDGLRVLIRAPFFRRLFTRVFAPKGIYEYVIARTRYIDEAFQKTLAGQFDQVLIFGPGFDTRALRFSRELCDTRIFELDTPVTQQAKIGQYRHRGLTIPANLTFIAIDFDKESLPEKLSEAGFERNHKSLFILEGLLMYLQPESVDATFQTIRDFAAKGSRIVFDFVDQSVFENGSSFYGKDEIVNSVDSAGEKWQFGMKPENVGLFLEKHSMRLIEMKSANDLERAYFCDTDGKRTARVNGTHNLVTAEIAKD